MEQVRFRVPRAYVGRLIRPRSCTLVLWQSIISIESTSFIAVI